MKIVVKSVVFAALASVALSSQAITFCPATIQQVANGASYHCVNRPGGADYGFLHFTATGLKQGQSYQCQITSDIVMLTYNSSDLPKGVKLVRSGDGHTPFSYQLDATAMQTTTGAATVVMYVPASDMTSNVSFVCNATK